MFAASRARVLARTVVVGAAAALGVVVFAVPAFAHITITPGSVAAGSAAVLTFHVPSEESGASTVRVDMRVPTAHPIAQLLVRPVPGWQISVKTITLARPLVTDDGSFSQAVSEVIWSGGQIAPGQFQDFSVSADPLPRGVASLAFKTIQTYSNGDVVRWIDVAQPGQPGPGHPAPVLTLTPAAGAAAAAAASSAAAPPAAPGSDGTARGIAAGGVLIGLAGLVLGTMGWRRARALAVALPPVPSLNGHGPAMAAAAGPGRDQRGDTGQPGAARPGPAPAPGGARAAAARGAPGGKAANPRRRSPGR